MPGEREPAARAVDVLIWLADHTADTWGVRQVAREMNTSPSTIHRIFQIFESRDLVIKNDEGRYTPGLELFRICQVFSHRLSPVKIARPHLERLAAACGETVRCWPRTAPARPDDRHRHDRRAAPAALGGGAQPVARGPLRRDRPESWASCPRPSGRRSTARASSRSPSRPGHRRGARAGGRPGPRAGLRLLAGAAVPGRHRARRAAVRRGRRRVR